MHTDEDPAIDDGYKKLLTAVLLVAWKDAHGRNSAQRAMALHWLRSTGAANVCDWLGLSVDDLRAKLNADREEEKESD